MSREHVRLTWRGAQVHAKVFDGAKPMMIAGREVSECGMGEGARFSLGGLEFLVSYPSEDGHPQVAQVPRRRALEFEMIEEIGRGAVGEVYKARDRETGQILAIKRLKETTSEGMDALAYFLRERDIVAELDHPCIAKTLCVGRDKDDLFIGMELIEGVNLEERVLHRTLGGPLSPEEAQRVGLDMLDALAYAHARELVHRDIKPGNVMLVETEEGLSARLLDFGLARNFARSTGQTITHSGEVRGTLLFVSPEGLRDAKRVKPTADIFGVGTTLYWALTAAPWFDEERYKHNIFPAILSCDLKPLRERRADLPDDLVAVIENAIRKEPGDRWASAQAMRDALAACTV